MRHFTATVLLAITLFSGCVVTEPNIPADYPQLSEKQRAHVVFDVDGAKHDVSENGLGIVFDDKTQAYQLLLTTTPSIGIWFPSLENGSYMLDSSPGQVKVSYEGGYDSDLCSATGSTFAHITVIGSTELNGETYRYGEFKAMVCGIVDPGSFLTVQGTWSALVEGI